MISENRPVNLVLLLRGTNFDGHGATQERLSSSMSASSWRNALVSLRDGRLATPLDHFASTQSRVCHESRYMSRVEK